MCVLWVSLCSVAMNLLVLIDASLGIISEGIWTVVAGAN